VRQCAYTRYACATGDFGSLRCIFQRIIQDLSQPYLPQRRPLVMHLCWNCLVRDVSQIRASSKTSRSFFAGPPCQRFPWAFCHCERDAGCSTVRFLKLKCFLGWVLEIETQPSTMSDVSFRWLRSVSSSSLYLSCRLHWPRGFNSTTLHYRHKTILGHWERLCWISSLLLLALYFCGILSS